MKKLKLLLFLFTITLCVPESFSQKEQKKFRDTLDNALDFSNFLINHHGVLPFVMPITEPAVGFGLAFGGLHFIPKKDPNQRPDIILAVGGLTTNDSWFGAVGYVGYWKNDRIRYRGFTGYADVNLTFYGFKPQIPVDFTMRAFIFSQQTTFRIKESNYFVGGKYQLSKITIPVFENGLIPGVDPFDYELWNSGVSLITEFDNLNNFMTPTKGVRVHLSYDQNLEVLGSDKDWGKFSLFSHMYKPLNDKWIAAFRIDTQIATGDVPFYAKPYVSLRGIPALRYQGDAVLVVETEQTHKIYRRWDLVGFAGIGSAFNYNRETKSNEFVWNVGTGARYLLARAYGLKTGFDVARGPEDWAFYITIGTSWFR